MNEEETVPCCSNITLQYNSYEQTLDKQEYLEGTVKEENVSHFDNDLRNYTFGGEEVEDVIECLKFEEEKYVISCQENYPDVKEELSDEAHFASICPFCNVEIFEEKSYVQHITYCKTKHLQFTKEGDLKQNDKIYRCEKCNFSTNLKHRLKEHLPIHSIGKLFKCTYKNCKCSQSLNLIEAKSCECDACGYATVFKRYLKRHVLAKHSNEEKKYKCRDCNYSTNTKQDLVKHVRIHAKRKLFKCALCEFTAVRSTHLRSHVLRKHSNEEKKYKCGYCEYSCHDKTNLTRHICIHTNEKPFKCDMCEFASTRRNHLNNHVLKKHSNEEKKYKCKDCKYSTHDRYTLLRHLSTQHNEKPYKCGACDFVTLRRTYLKKHVLAKHSA